MLKDFSRAGVNLSNIFENIQSQKELRVKKAVYKFIDYYFSEMNGIINSDINLNIQINIITDIRFQAYFKIQKMFFRFGRYQLNDIMLNNLNSNLISIVDTKYKRCLEKIENDKIK